MKIATIYSRFTKYGGLHVIATGKEFYPVGTKFTIKGVGYMPLTCKKVSINEKNSSLLDYQLVDDGCSEIYSQGKDIRIALGKEVVPVGVDVPKKTSNTRAVKNLNTGKVFDSTAEAARFYNIKDPSKITKVCKGVRNTAGGYVWSYVD